MTISGDTVCSVIQAFPVLLILAQNQKRCLNTPLIYKPPSPTQSPEFIEAYNTLLNSFIPKKCYEYGHGHSSGYYDLGHGAPCQDSPSFGQSYPTFGQSYPTFEHSYPSYANSYPNYANSYPSYANSYPSYAYPSHGHTPSIHTIPVYPSFKSKVFNISTGYGKGQTKNVKYKIVVKKNRVVKRRRSGKLRGFQNERAERRYASFFDLPKNLVNFLPDTIKNIPGRLTAIVYRPVTTPDNQKNQYGLANGNNYQNPNPNWNNHQNHNPVYPNYQNGHPVYSNNPNNQAQNWNNGNNADQNWNNGNNAEPIWNNGNSGESNGNQVNPNRDETNQDYQNGNKNNENQVNPNQYESSKPQPQPFPTQPPVDTHMVFSSSEENIPNDYVNFNDDKVSTSPPVLHEPEGKNNGETANITSEIPVAPPDNFQDKFGEAVVTDAPLQALTPVDSGDNVNFAVFQDSCTTVEGGTGTCTVIFSCPQYSRLISQARTSPDSVQLLRKVHCGFEGSTPKVCCPASSIPTNPPPNATTPTTTTTTTTSDPSEGRELDDVMLQPPVCGVSNATNSRVVGGAPARLADFPWMALLGYKPRRGSDPRWLCGGSLISARHVLTAAHCIHGHEDDLYMVRLGELDLASDDDGATPTDVPVTMKVKHEEYSPQSFTNDIGLLLLEKPVEFTYLIRPICIPQDRELMARSFENYTPTIAGWGDTEFRGPAATHLQALQLPVVSNEFCANAYKAYKAQVIDERVLCAGYKKGGHDACQGDSGGPLMQPIWMMKERVTYFYQIGVVSYGKKCAEAGFPGVYTRVTKFVPWIQKHVAETQNL